MRSSPTDDNIAECARVQGFEAEVRSAASIPPLTACLEIRRHDLVLTLRNLRQVGLLFTPTSGTRVITASGASAWEKLSERTESAAYGRALLPGGGTLSMEIPVLSEFPLSFQTSVDTGSLLYESMVGALTSFLSPAPGTVSLAEAECAQTAVSNEGHNGSVAKAFLSCLKIPIESLPAGVLKTISSVLLTLNDEGNRFLEMIAGVFGDEDESIVVVRRTGEQLDPALSSAFDRHFVYQYEGFRYRANIHFGDTTFPVEHACESQTASPGWTWIEIPYTIRSLTHDRHAPVIAPVLVLVDRQELDESDWLEQYFGSGTEVLDPQQLRFGSEPDSCVILSGDYSSEADGIKPLGRMDGVYVTSSGWCQGAINEYQPMNNYVIAVYTGPGAFYKLEDLAGPWDLFGNRVTE